MWMAFGTLVADPLLAQVAVQGVVVDDVSGQPLKGSRVLLLNRYNKIVGYEVADVEGRFSFKPRDGTRLRLEAMAVGYLPTITPVLWMAEDRDSVVLEIRLAPHVVLLAPVEVVAMSAPKTSPVLENAEFRRSKGLGVHLTRADIEQRRPVHISDMLVTVPGVYAEQRRPGAGGRTVSMRRAGKCPVQIFLDGMLATRGGDGGGVVVDDLVSPLDVEVIEVFRGLASIPPEFLTREARCGVIAIWTRRGLEPQS
jgi:hypothetical protein